MAKYTVTCKACGAVHLGNSKWIPLSAVQKAGRNCHACGSSETVITSGWRKKKKPHEYNTQKPSSQDPLNVVAKNIGAFGAILILCLPIGFMALVAWWSPSFKSSSPQDDYEYCSPGFYGREC